MSKELAGRRILITGGGRGIGRAIALASAREGARVAIAARSEDQLASVTKEIQAVEGTAVPLVCDVADVSQVERMVGDAANALGSIDILVNNAGGGTESAPVAESTPQLWIECISVNLVGTYACARFVLPHMIANGGGKIINIGSGMGHEARPAARRTTRRRLPCGCLRSVSRWRSGSTASRSMRLCPVLFSRH